MDTSSSSQHDLHTLKQTNKQEQKEQKTMSIHFFFF